MRKLLRFLGYTSVFFVSVFLFAYWTFPYDYLRDWIIYQVETKPNAAGRRIPSGYELDIASLEPSWFTGVDLRGVRFVKVTGNLADGPMDIACERAHARIALLPLITGTKKVTFDADLADGHAQGTIGVGDETSVDVAFESLNLAAAPILRGLTKLPLQGQLTGEVMMVLPEDLEEAFGDIDIQLRGLIISDGESKIPIPGLGALSNGMFGAEAGITIPQIQAGNILLKATVDEGAVNVEELRGRGEDVRLDGVGHVFLKNPLPMSRLDLLLRVRLTEHFTQKDARAKLLIDKLRSSRLARRALTSDGSLQYRVGGSVGARVRARPAGSEQMEISDAAEAKNTGSAFDQDPSEDAAPEPPSELIKMRAVTTQTSPSQVPSPVPNSAEPGEPGTKPPPTLPDIPRAPQTPPDPRSGKSELTHLPAPAPR